MSLKVPKSKAFDAMDALPKLKQQWVLIGLAGIASNLLALSLPLLMLQLYDRIIPQAAYSTLSMIIVSVLVAVLMETSIRMARTYITSWSAARFEHKLMTELVNRFLAEPLHRFEQKGTGAVLQQFSAVTTLKYHHSGQTFQNLLDLPFTFLYIGIVFILSTWLGGLLIAGYIVYGFLTWFTQRRNPQLFEEHRQADLRRNNFLTETLTNIHTIKSMSMEFLMMRRYARLQESCAKVVGRLTYSLDMFNVTGTSFSSVMTMLIMSMGAWLVVENQLSNGELVACMMLGSRALGPVQRLGSIWSKHQKDKILKKEIQQVLTQDALPIQASTFSAPPSCWLTRNFQPASLSVKDLQFQFSGSDSPILSKINFDIAPGEFVWLDIPSGAGRSTLLQILAGVLPPQSGVVKVNLQSKSNGNIAYISRDAQIFEGSLIENISLYDSGRVENSLACAHAIGFDNFISKLPKGWDTVVGDMASESLPQGYRQRISIIRALSGEPEFLLIDDAASTLDAEGELMFYEFLKSLRNKLTVLIVSDRSSFQQLASRKIQLEMPLTSQSSGSNSVSRSATTGSKLNDKSTSSLLLPKSNFVSSSRWQDTHEAVHAQFREISDLEECLVPLLKHLNSLSSAREVAEALPYFYDHLDLTQFNNTMSRLGFNAYVWRCNLGTLENHSLPCLFVPENENAFVVIKREGNDWLVHAPSNTQPHRESRLNLNGQACVYIPEIKSDARLFSWIKVLLPRFSKLYWQATFAALLTGVLLTVSPILMMHIFSTIIPSGSSEGLLNFIYGALIVLLVSHFFSQNRVRVLAHLSSRIEFLFGSAIFEKILRMPPSMTEKASVGSQMARLKSFEAIRDSFTGPVAATIMELPASLVLLVALALINPICILVFIGLIASYWVLYKLFSNRTADAVKKLGVAVTERNRFLIQMVSKMRSIRTNDGTQAWLNRFRRISADATLTGLKVERLTTSFIALSQLLMTLSALIIIAASTPMVIAQTLSSGALIASMFLMWRVLNPLQILFTNITRIERIKSAASQIDNLMRMEVEGKRASPSIGNHPINGRINFSRVSFRYLSGTDPAISGLDFAIEPGEIFAVSGSSGAGKSTLLKLVLGLYSPQGGAILIDGTDIRQFDPLALRRYISYAPQDIHLFRATLDQNLRLARPDASTQDIINALDMAGAMEQIQLLPLGIQTRIGDNTHLLSSSLRQKLSLARAYLTQAPIMLLDEPGALLDKEGEAQFIKTLSALRGKVTVILVSQQENYLRTADRVLVMDHGFMRAIGKPSELLLHKSVV
jgi:ATP-binding cassette subfamily C protein LapB